MKIILLIALFYSILSLKAQESTHNRFETVKDSGFIWILPENFDQAFDRLQQDQWDKFIPADHLDENDLSGWFFFESKARCEQKADVNKEDFKAMLSPWEKAIPRTLIERFNEYIPKRIDKTMPVNYFFIDAIIDRQGNVLTIVFRVDSLVADLVKEEELSLICKRTANMKIDVGKLSFAHHSIAQDREFDQKLEQYLQEKGLSIGDIDFNPIEKFEKEYPRTEAEYGILHCCTLERQRLPGLDYPIWEKVSSLPFRHFTAWDFDTSDKNDMLLVLPESFDQTYNQLLHDQWNKSVPQRTEDPNFIGHNVTGWEHAAGIKWKEDVSPDTRTSIRLEWAQAIPETLIKTLQDNIQKKRENVLAEKRVYGSTYFKIYTIVDKQGKIHDAYFWVEKCAADLLEEKDLLQIRKNLMKKQIDVNLLYFCHYTLSQNEHVQQQLKENPDLDIDTLYQTYTPEEAQYGILLYFELK